MCPAGDADVRVEPSLPESVDLREERPWVDHAAVAEDPGLSTDGAARDERELVLHPVAHDRVSGVVAALEPHDHVRRPAPAVDERALALVAELGADDGDRH